MDSIETAKSRLGLGNFQFQYLSLVAQQLDPRVGKIPWRRKWQPTAIFLPGKSHRRRSLAGYSPWSRKVRHNLVTKHEQRYLFTHLSLYINF